jgi:Zn-dependent protease with chaperone function
MDFFERQDKARRNTAKLVTYFALAVVFLIITVYAVFILVFSRKDLWNPEILLWVSLGTLAVIIIGSLTKTAELARGGGAVAEMLGGELLNPNTNDPDERKLLNVVEEMALASGMQVPAVYLLRHEQGINAFAAGHTTNDAAIGVTRGCIQILDRDELQGVIAHEFSHILNGDMRLNVRLIGIIFGIMCLALIGRILIHMRGSSNSKNQNPLPFIGLALILIGGIGVFFGRLIQAAVSRQREFLADSAAVQFTRNPDGIAGALKKIGGLAQGSQLKSAHAAEAGHLFFGNGLSLSFGGAFATHPPLTQRIKALDPGFDGSYPAITLPEPGVPASRSTARTRGGAFPFPFPQTKPNRGGGPAFANLAAPLVIAQSVLPHAGIPSTVHLRKAAEIRDALTLPLQDATHDALGASAIIYTLLLSDEHPIRERQLELVAQKLGTPTQTEMLKLEPDIRDLPADHRLPLIDLAVSGLRELSPGQYFAFKQAVDELVRMDGAIDLFEYALQSVVMHHLAPQFEPPQKQVIQFYALKALIPDIAVVLSALAYVGHQSPAHAQSAFERGAAAIIRATQAPLMILDNSRCTLDLVDAALKRLGKAAPQIKKSVLTAGALTVAADGKIESREAELLRAIASTLDCPLPPFVG